MAKSCLPSALKSAMTMRTGSEPVAKPSVYVNVPLPFPSNTENRGRCEAVSYPETTRSSLPSLFKSAVATVLEFWMVA